MSTTNHTAAGDFYRVNKDRAVVSLKLFHCRVRRGTPWEEALTRESRKGDSLIEYYRANKAIAKVAYNTFKKAVSRGTPRKEAILGNTIGVAYTRGFCTQYLEANKHISDIPLKTFYDRVNSRGFSLESALRTPHGSAVFNKKKFYRDNQNRAKIGYSGFCQRIAGGMTPEQALTTPHAYGKS